ncbi:tyrosine-type recombinase/integrase [Micromonospora chalcea]|uniref:tyrosine-type recombinase/integrase n=1 Tax=Micromonospora chalcea TaxID=1874 RepID=UPI0033E56844
MSRRRRAITDRAVAEGLRRERRAIGPAQVRRRARSAKRAALIRPVAVLFTSARGKLLTDTYWSELRADWRQAAGWPKEGTFHSLRHFFATTLMSNGVEPQEVQKALRHANLRITLETYVHWLPRKDRPRGLVGNLLRQADGKSSERATGQDQN